MAQVTGPAGCYDENQDAEIGRSPALGSQAGSRPGGLSQYPKLLRTPGALAFSSAAFVGRMPMSMFGLGTVLLISLLTGRYGAAGAVAAVGSIGYAIGGPVVAKLADRHGQRRVLRPQLAAFTVTVTAFIACAELRAPFWALLLTGVASGTSMPALGTMVRSRWSNLVGTDPGRLHIAFALESVADELIFVIGPALATLLATQFLPASGVAAAWLLCLIGTLAFTALDATEPPSGLGSGAAPSSGQDGTRQHGTGQHGTRQHGTGEHGTGEHGAAADGAGQPGPAGGARDRGWLTQAGLRARLDQLVAGLPAPGLVTLAPVFLLMGATFSTIDLSTVAFASERGDRALSGIVLGTYALGSAVGGLWYGSKHWETSLGIRFTLALTFSVCGFLSYWAMPGILALAAAGFLSSLAVAPAISSGYAILEAQAPPHRRTEGMAWLSSTISVGVAFGSALTGRIIDTHGSRWGLAAAGLTGVAAVTICVAGIRRLTTDRSGS